LKRRREQPWAEPLFLIPFGARHVPAGSMGSMPAVLRPLALTICKFARSDNVILAV
jgi:hypothetical protein